MFKVSTEGRPVLRRKLSYVKYDSESVHFVIEMTDDNELRLRKNSLNFKKDKDGAVVDDDDAKKQNGVANGIAKAVRNIKKRRGKKKSDANGSVPSTVAEADEKEKPRVRRRCSCPRRSYVMLGVVLATLLLSSLFVLYVNSEVERYCYDTFPAWVCDSTGATHIKCQLKALFMCRYTVEWFEYAPVFNVTAAVRNCENVIENICTSIYVEDNNNNK